MKTSDVIHRNYFAQKVGKNTDREVFKKMFHGIMIKLKLNTVLIYIEVSYNLERSLLKGHLFLWYNKL